MKRLIHYLMVLMLCGGYILVFASPAAAICHVVTISASPNPVTEADTNVTATITRQIFGAGCTATINYTTEDGTAREPGDYTKKTGHCTEFDTNPLAPTCTFTVPIKGDTVYEGDETFKVSFSGTSESAVSGSATVTIKDNDTSPTPPPPPPAPPKATPTASPTSSPTPTTTAAPTTGASPGTPLVIAGTTTPTGSPTPLAGGKTSEKKGASAGLIIGVIAILLAAGAGVGLWFLRKTPA